MPSPFNTLFLAIRSLFFSEKALYALFLNSGHTFNLVCLYFVLQFIPFRDMDGAMSPQNVGQIVEGVTLSLLFIAVLFIYLPKKMPVLIGFTRVMFAYETTSVFLPLSILLKTGQLKYFHPVFMAWYISLAIFAMNKIRGGGYFRCSLIVFMVFIFVTTLPALF